MSYLYISIGHSDAYKGNRPYSSLSYATQTKLNALCWFSPLPMRWYVLFLVTNSAVETHPFWIQAARNPDPLDYLLTNSFTATATATTFVNPYRRHIFSTSCFIRLNSLHSFHGLGFYRHLSFNTGARILLVSLIHSGIPASPGRGSLLTPEVVIITGAWGYEGVAGEFGTEIRGRGVSPSLLFHSVSDHCLVIQNTHSIHVSRIDHTRVHSPSPFLPNAVGYGREPDHWRRTAFFLACNLNCLLLLLRIHV